MRPAVALSIAGTDPSGGAGVAADIKTFTARKVLGTSAITALVVQNTQGVSRAEPVSPIMLADQLAAVFGDLPVDASKTGMLANAELVEVVASAHQQYGFGFYTLDPVLVATSGHPLLRADAIELLRHKLLPCANLITPNLPEAAFLLKENVATTREGMINQAKKLLTLGARAVLLKGGHGTEKDVWNVLVTQQGTQQIFRHPRIATRNTHGTGCTLSAAITADIARFRQQYPHKEVSDAVLGQAVSHALNYLHRALASASHWQLGTNPHTGHGPVDHQVDLSPVDACHPNKEASLNA